MSNRIVNLLPRDTRILEITSGASLLFYAFTLIYYRENIVGLILADRPEFWIFAFFILGAFQLTSIIFEAELIVLRTITAWFSGYYWLWDGTNSCSILEQSCSGVVNIECILKIILGIGISYAFIINLGFARQRWKV